MSETRNLRHPEPGDVEAWRAAFDELDLRMDALRQAFLDGVRSFNMTDEIVESASTRASTTSASRSTPCTARIRSADGPGQEDCRFEPPVALRERRGPPAGS